MTDDDPRVVLSIDDQCVARWLAGRERYGPEWVGDAPILEAIDEVVDALNYCDEDARQHGIDPTVAWVRRELLGLACFLREIARRRAREAAA